VNAGTFAATVPAATANRATERGLANLVSQSAVLVGRNLRLALTAGTVVAMVVTPLVFLAGFLAVFDKLFDARGIDFAQYLPPAIVVMWMMLTAVSAALFFSRDRRTGMLTRQRSLPIHRGSVLVARLAADFVRGLISIGVVVAAAYVVGFEFKTGVAGAVGFVVVALAFLLTLTAGTSAVGLGSTEPEAIASALQMPNMPLLMLSTAFAPVDAFPGWLQPVVEISPVTAVVETLRAFASGGELATPLWRAVAWLVVLLAVFSWAAARAFRRAA
jgi:ABC-2 type transport system permease protein